MEAIGKHYLTMSAWRDLPQSAGRSSRLKPALASKESLRLAGLNEAEAGDALRGPATTWSRCAHCFNWSAVNGSASHKDANHPVSTLTELSSGLANSPSARALGGRRRVRQDPAATRSSARGARGIPATTRVVSRQMRVQNDLADTSFWALATDY